MSRWTVRRARTRLAELEDRLAELERDGERMVSEFRHRFPDAPAYIARYTDRTLTRWRWRRSSARRWRGSLPRGVNPTFELTGEQGRLLLRQLPEPVREAWLRYERQRVDLNLFYALARYERARIEDWLARRASLAQAGSGGSPADETLAEAHATVAMTRGTRESEQHNPRRTAVAGEK